MFRVVKFSNFSIVGGNLFNLFFLKLRKVMWISYPIESGISFSSFLEISNFSKFTRFLKLRGKEMSKLDDKFKSFKLCKDVKQLGKS